jgi:hypothetical protein
MFLILGLLLAFIFYRVETASTRLLSVGGMKMETLVRDAFLTVARVQPRIIVNERTVFEQSSPSMELAVVEREMTVERDTSATWLGSTKRLRLRAMYRVKAGFDLRQPFSVRVDDRGNKIKAQLPAAKILSVEQVRVESLDMSNGYWNRVQPEELETELNTLNAQARLKALEAGLPREAVAILVEQLRQKLGPGYELEVSTPTGPVAPLVHPSPTPKP